MTGLRQGSVGLALLVVLLLVISTLVATLGGAGPPPAPASRSVSLTVHPFSASLNLSPSRGVVGSSVTAAGLGFPANSTIGIELGGRTVTSRCSSDANGSFPGSSGSPCTFSVPVVPGGNYTVVARQMRGVAGIGVGSTPYGVAYDPRLGELFVANELSDNVTVINDSTDSTVASIGVGQYPASLDFDAALGEVFVANYGTNNVSVINVSSDTVVATVGVGTNPFGVAYDAGTAEVFVANAGSGSVSVIADSNDSVVATVAVGSNPYGTVYDAALGEVFVCDLGAGSMSVIADANDTVVSTIGVGNSPDAAAYDPATGAVVVANLGSSNITVISAATDSVVANVSVGNMPEWAVFAPTAHEFFVANGGSGTVSVVSDSTYSVVETLGVGTSPDSGAYDAGQDEVVIANGGSRNVTVLPAQGGVQASTVFSIEPTLSVAPGSGAVGRTVDVRGTGFSANATISLSFGGGALNATCLTDSSGTFPGTTGSACRFAVPASAAPGADNVTASDGTFTATAPFSALPGLTISPSRAGVGTTVVASGNLFGASATIRFTVAGTAVASNCSTDATGAFPGTSGTPCTFSVPTVAASRGPVSVVASDGTSTASAPLTIVASLAVAPGAGPVGARVMGTGFGFRPGVPVNFTVGGVPVGTNCSTDPNGTFPGTSGTSCTFLVPAASGGNATVLASGSTGASAVAVGTNPYGIAYDPNLGELFVANEGSNNVTVINDSTNAVVASVGVGTNPASLDYDEARGQVFVANYGSSNVSVIDASTDTVVATVSVGTNPFGVSYDAGTSEVFVANAGSNSVSVIADSNDSVVATIGVGANPYGTAYDPALGEVFVCDLVANAVSVISDANDSVVATIAVGTNPNAAVYDAGAAEVFVANLGSSNISVIADATDRVVANVGVGSQPYWVTYDPDLGEVFAVNGGSDNLSAISDSTDLPVVAGGTGPSPRTAAYDLGSGALYVVNSGSDNVSVAPLGDEATTVLRIESSLALLSPSTGVDVGQTATVAGSGFGSSLVVDSIVLGTYALNCTSARTGNCTNGVLTTDNRGSVVASFLVPSSAAPGAYSVELTDSAGNRASTNLTLLSDPEVSVPSPSASSIDLGQTVTFTTVATFGSGSYAYSWIGLPTGCSGSASAILCTPTAAETSSITVRVTDSDGFSITSGPLHFVTYPDPVASLPTSTASSGAVDAGQSVTISTVATLGTGNYLSFAWSGLPGACTAQTANLTCAGADLPAGTYGISVRVTDSNNFSSSASADLSFVVLADPQVSGPVPSVRSADVRQTVTFTATPSLGSGTYTYRWAGLPSGCAGTPSAVVNCTPTIAASYAVAVTVTDSNNASVTSGTVGFEVFADPVVNLSSSRGVLDAGQPVQIRATATLGSGGYAFDWTGLPKDCTGLQGNWTCTFPAPGRDPVSVSVKDSNGEQSGPATVPLTVDPALSAAVAALPNSPVAGTLVLLWANASGGTGPISVAWELGDGNRGTGSAVNHTYATPGTFAVVAWVNDSVGGSLEKFLNLTVTGALSPTGAGAPLLEIGIAIAGVAVVAVLAFLLLARRRARSPPPDAPGVGAADEVPGDSEGAPSEDPP